MKFKLSTFLFAALTLFSTSASAQIACQTTDAFVTGIFPWSDGATFVELSKPNNCSCSITSRFAFYPTDPNSKTLLAIALTALANNNKVIVYGNPGCGAHGNTSVVFSIVISNSNATNNNVINSTSSITGATDGNQ